MRTDPSRPDTRTLPPGTRAGWPTGEADERLVTRHSEGNSAETTTSTGADGTQTFASKTELALRLVSHPMRVRQYRPGCPGDCPGLIHLVRDPAPLVRLPLAGRLTGTDSWTCRPESASYAPGLDSTNHPSPLPGRFRRCRHHRPRGVAVLAESCQVSKSTPLQPSSRSEPPPVPASSGRDIDQRRPSESSRLDGRAQGANWCST